MSKRAKRTEKKRKPKKKINSRQKGATAEVELSHVFTAHGIAAKRGQQHAGGVESPDVVALAPGFPFHIESKRVEAGNLYKWLDQATRDAGNKIPLVVHRRNGRHWVAILLLEDFLNYVV